MFFENVLFFVNSFGFFRLIHITYRYAEKKKSYIISNI